MANETPGKPRGTCSQLLALVVLELKRRQLLRDLAETDDEVRLVRLEIEFLGIEIPWMVCR